MIRFNLIILTFLLFGLTSFIKGQEVYKTESETHIFWQPDRVLKSSDFKGNGSDNPNNIKYCDNYDLCTMAYVGVFSVLDIPKKKSKRGKLIEKAYFAAAFDKTTSYILKSDSLGVDKQKIVFDIYEASARLARQQLKQIQDTVKGYGMISIMFKTIEAKAIKMRTELCDSYTKDVYIDKTEGAYEKWRKLIDRLLEDSKEFASKPEDCYRFIKAAPIDDDYIVAEKVIDNLNK